MSKETNSNQATATIKYLRISASKIRRIANHVRGKNVDYALAVLQNLPHKGAKYLYDAIHSAKSNAIHNQSLSESSLVVSQLLVNEGTKMKRYRPRARGRMFAIEKKSAHIFVRLEGES